MHNPFLVWLRISFIVLLFISLSTSANLESSKGERSSKREAIMEAKRNFVDKEREYMKKQPLSSNLKLFIERAKRSKRKRSSRYRVKRSQGNQEIYIFRNGNLIPIQNAKRQINNSPSALRSYTVVPLIIPISYAVPSLFEFDEDGYKRLTESPSLNRMDVTLNGDMFFPNKQANIDPNFFTEQLTTPYTPATRDKKEEHLVSTETVTNVGVTHGKLVKHKEESLKGHHKTLIDDYAALRAQLIPDKDDNDDLKKVYKEISELLATNTSGKLFVSPIEKHVTSPTALPTISLNQEDLQEPGFTFRPRQDYKREKNETNEKIILKKILTDVEGLMEGKRCETEKEGLVCVPAGKWVSEAAGMELNIGGNSSTVEVSERTPPRTTGSGFMCDTNWAIKAELPVSNTGLIILSGSHQKDKEIATFVGECRVCSGAETILGTWSLRRYSRDCTDRNMAERIFTDYWRKDNVDTLRERHLREINESTHNSTDSTI